MVVVVVVAGGGDGGNIRDILWSQSGRQPQYVKWLCGEHRHSHCIRTLYGHLVAWVCASFLLLRTSLTGSRDLQMATWLQLNRF